MYVYVYGCECSPFDLCFCHRLALGEGRKSMSFFAYILQQTSLFLLFQRVSSLPVSSVFISSSYLFYGGLEGKYRHKKSHSNFKREEGLLLISVENLPLVRSSDIQIAYFDAHKIIEPFIMVIAPFFQGTLK